MNHTSGNIDELLIRILDDTATRADVRMFAEWIRAEENRKYFEQYKKIWHTTTGVQCDDQAVEEGWQDYKQFMLALPERKKRVFYVNKRGSIQNLLIFARFTAFTKNTPNGNL